MDRVNQLRAGGEADRGDSTLDTSSPLSEAFVSANESSKYFSLSDSTFDLNPSKDVSLASAASTAEADRTVTDGDELISDLSPIAKKDVMLDSYKIGKQIEAANILSGGVEIFDDNENSFDGDELVIDDNVELDDKTNLDKADLQLKSDEIAENTLVESPVDLASKDTEVVLQIDGKNVDAIDIGNGLYLYRKDGQEELAAVQIITEDDQQQPSFKFLKVRENAEGNLEVYEEFEIEVTKEVPANDSQIAKKSQHMPIKDVNRAISDGSSSKDVENKDKLPPKEEASTSAKLVDSEVKQTSAESKTELNFNGKMMKFSESRKSPVVGSFTPMTYHSTPNKEGKPLTKTMVDLQLHPSRHSDNVKKTIEVHTDSQSKKLVTDESHKSKLETQTKINASDNMKDSLSTDPTEESEDMKKSKKDLNIVNDSSISHTANIKQLDKQNNSLGDIPKKMPDEILMNVGITLTKVENIVTEHTDNKNKAKNAEPEMLDKDKKEKDGPELLSITSLSNSAPGIAMEIKCSENIITDSEKTNTEKLLTKDLARSGSTKDENDDTITILESKNVDQIIEKSQKVEIHEQLLDSTTDAKGSEKATSSKDVHSSMQNFNTTNQKRDNISQRESSNGKLDEVSKTLLPLEAPLLSALGDLKPKDKLQSIPTVKTELKKICQDDKFAVGANMKAKETVTETTLKEGESNKSSKETKPDFPMKGIESNQINKENAVNAEVKSGKLTPASETIEPKTISKTESDKSTVENATVFKKESPKLILNDGPAKTAVEIVSIKPDSLISKTDPIAFSAIDVERIFNLEKCIPVSKEMEQKMVPKTEILTPVAKYAAPKLISMSEKINSVPKNETGIIGRAASNPQMFIPIVSKVDPKSQTIMNNVLKTTDGVVAINSIRMSLNKAECTTKETRLPQVISNPGAKPINNNHAAAVPFGKWTDANRQEFLNKFKEIKVPAPSNTKQIKNSNDLNRIDVLKKIDSQRSNNASSKTQEKSTVNDTVFSNKIAPPKVTKIPVKNEGPKVKPKAETVTDNSSKQDGKVKEKVTSSVTASVGTSECVKPDIEERRNVNVNMTNLITRTIVDMLNRPVPMTMCKSSLSEPKPRPIETTDVKNTSEETRKNSNTDIQKLDDDSSGSLDDIEMKMNELHGIPFVERPPHELPRVHKTYSKTSKDTKKVQKKNIVAHTVSKQNLVQTIIDVDSDEEVIEHEPVTGDLDLSKKNAAPKLTSVKTHVSESKAAPTTKEPEKKDVVITENDFDKFARRNSITYENCLAVKFEGKEPANVVQTVKEKDAKQYPRNEITCMDSNMKLPPKQYQNAQSSQNVYVGQVSHTGKFGTVPEDPNSKNYQSKIATAYQSALNSKRHIDRPITIIEDKPVKVVFMDANIDFVPNQLNVQGKELSPAKKTVSVEPPASTTQSENIDVTDVVDDSKLDDVKTKTKHQRKQVLTPVEVPELEVIQQGELGIDVSPKKKRKTDDNKTDKHLINPVHKKQYLLGRSTLADDKPADITHPTQETTNITEVVPERSAVSAIDSLVKAAELLENQSVQSNSANPDAKQNTPVKRGRGRPRKYPLPEGTTDNKVPSPSPQKKPRLIDAKPEKSDSITDENESTDEDEIIRENWTMGKINENIVCPICNKLFRSENVVFKHVKHCTGVSPSRSESEKISPRRRRQSVESDNKSFDSKSDDMEVDEKPNESVKKTPKKRKSRESAAKYEKTGQTDHEIIVIEDTPVKDQITKERTENPKTKSVENIVKEPTNQKELTENKAAKVKKLTKTHFGESSNDLVCEFCGKTFRQLSYLVNHKIQHQKETKAKLEMKATNKLQVFSCEVCRKEFRKLHHLVQHRIIHNPEVPSRTLRKISSEQSENKNLREQTAPKQNDDASAGFRCEPCDKSFRKLHHLVEHRETHDGINRQKNTTAQPVVEKQPHTCDVCKKTFRKLNHLIEHKEQHVEQLETSSEKSDDKSVKSSLSTKDIIHECSLCYMVFPNEHSLNKHFVICQQKKKRQSKQKEKPVDVDDPDKAEECSKSEESLDEDSNTPKIVAEEIIHDDAEVKSEKGSAPIDMTQKDEDRKKCERNVNIETQPSQISKVSRSEFLEIKVSKENEDNAPEVKIPPSKREHPISADSSDTKKVVPEKVKKLDHSQVKEATKKTPVKDKVAPTVTKRQKSGSVPSPAVPDGKPVDSSDDDEVRYMLNPNFKTNEISEEKTFMKVRTNKRNSLQIERPNSRELMIRRTSLQHPPKIPRLKAKAVEPKVVPTTLNKNIAKISKSEVAASTDSDDSDVKYSFPDKSPQDTLKPVPAATPKEKKGRKSLAEKRQSLTGIAKRKSAGQALIAKHKPNPSLVRVIKRRTLDVEHRCDCGQLFNSAAMLSRHTSVAHTPPRIRRRRSPPPAAPLPAAPAAKPPRSSADNPPKTARKSSDASVSSKPTRKSSVKSDTIPDARKSSAKSAAPPVTRKSIRPEQSNENSSSAKPRRSAAHSGVPVPQKMRKLLMKSAK